VGFDRIGAFGDYIDVADLSGELPDSGSGNLTVIDDQCIHAIKLIYLPD
jgi:hypothetical protein